ncbi:MAG TPA: cytochrome c [Methanosarcinales archaeon]|nr:cytochrome c [Methanosarcinales archaeon]
MNSKSVIIIIIAIAIIFGGSTIWQVLADEDKPGNTANNNNIKDKGLPQSLDQYYTETAYPGMPFEYLLEMYKLGESMMGIPVNLGQGDLQNAGNSFEEFSECYEYSSKMVPEWQKYYNQKAVDELGRALADGDQDAIGEAMEEVGETCSDCHLDTLTPVYYKYYWGDFRDVMIETPDGPIPWKDAKMYYLLMGFDGIGVNINEGDQDGAQESFELFDSMFDNMTDACLECHDSEPRYYVSEDIQGMIDTMGVLIDAGNLEEANGLRYGIGDSCHRCHIVHMPPQYAKVDGE